MSSTRAFIVVMLLGCGALSYDTHAVPVTPQTVVIAQQTLPVAAGAVSDVASMSKLFPYIFRLPRGILKTGLAVLPGVSATSGMKDIGQGLHATSVFAKGTLGLPFKVLGRSLNTISRISPTTLAGL